MLNYYKADGRKSIIHMRQHGGNEKVDQLAKTKSAFPHVDVQR